MSKLNDIYNSYGKTFSVAIANTYSYNIMNASGLPKNTLIVSAPNETNDCSLLITDYVGDPIRLTYNITEGNGLVSNNGAISIELDSYMFGENSYGQLTLNQENLVDNSTIKDINGKFTVDTSEITKATANIYGVAKTDGTTILANDGQIYANTQKLDKSNNSTQVYGIVKGSNTVNANNGVLSVNTEKLDKATDLSYGIVKLSNPTMLVSNGVISVNLNSFGPTSNTSYGLSRPDNDSIYKTQEKCLKINYSALKTASSTNYGFVKPDNESTVVENGVLKVKNYSQIQQKILELGSTIYSLDNKLNEMNDYLSALVPSHAEPHIFTLVCDGLASVDLMKPEYYGELPGDMPMEKITASFIVNTNCPFKIALQYIDNISPAISLFEIKYNDVDSYPGETGLTRTYQSTNNMDAKISFSWICKNYAAVNTDNYSIKTRVIIDVMYANDISVKKEVKYSVVRFNSMYIGGIINSFDENEMLINDDISNIIPILNYRIQVDNSSYQLNDSIMSYTLPNSNEGALYDKLTYLTTKKYKIPWIQNIHDIHVPDEHDSLQIIKNTTYEFTNEKPSLNVYIQTSNNDEWQLFKTLEQEDLAYLTTSFKCNGNDANNIVMSINNNSSLTFSYL